MGRGHERFAQLAVGHVLGGLADHDATEFRSHLIGCRDCQRHVTELRDIASELAAADRDERQARLKTEVARRAEVESDDDTTRGWSISPAAGIAAVVLLGTLVGLVFWNLHLRESNAALLSTAEIREATLAELADGVVAPVDTAAGVRGVVVANERRVTWTIAGLPEPRAGERLVVWLSSDDESEIRQEVFAAQGLPEGLLAAGTPLGDADQLEVSLEGGQPGDEPEGAVLLTADLGERAADDTTPEGAAGDGDSG